MKRHSSSRSISAPLFFHAALALAPLASAQGAPCAPSWLDTFGAMPGATGEIHALATFDDGTGTALYVGGFFDTAGGVAAEGIACWDGSAWAGVGGGTQQGGVYALALFDDGGGEALYAGGNFTGVGGVAASRIARWDGTTWSALGDGISGGSIQSILALAVFDDGSGPALYAAGDFTSAGGTAASSIAKWDGSAWSALGNGVDDPVFALAVHDDGTGAALYAGGFFATAGGSAASRIARWDGTSWSPVGGGVAGQNPHVLALTVFDDGSGAALHAGGSFSSAGGVAASRIARWDGTSWSALAGGVNDVILALGTYDDGGGARLFAGGVFTTADGVAASRVARWDGSGWSGLGSEVSGAPLTRVRAFTELDDGGGPKLALAGDYLSASATSWSRVATWNGSSWRSLGRGLNDFARALVVEDDGSGPALYAGGAFTAAGDLTVNRVARWDGSSWAPLGSGLDGEVRALTWFDDGSGPALYAGGAFTAAGGLPALRAARWDGSQWTALGAGLDGSAGTNVRCLAVFDDGGGAALFAGGDFTTAGGLPASAIARWDGSNWSTVGGGVGGFTPDVRALLVHDDGGGEALYAAGAFTTAGGLPARRIARWDGWSWTTLGTGMSHPVEALCVFDDGGGSALFAGGLFGMAGSASSVGRIAKWDGLEWSALIGGGANDEVLALGVLDDGSGAAIYAGGGFTTVGGLPARGIARWDGAAWSALDAGTGVAQDIAVEALAALDLGDRQTLHVGGRFAGTADSEASFLATWAGCLDSTAPEIDCPPALFVRDLRGSPAGESVTFTVTATDNMDPAPSLVCNPPSGSFFARGTTFVLCTATDASGNVSTCTFPVHVLGNARER